MCRKGLYRFANICDVQRASAFFRQQLSLYVVWTQQDLVASTKVGSFSPRHRSMPRASVCHNGYAHVHAREGLAHATQYISPLWNRSFSSESSSQPPAGWYGKGAWMDQAEIDRIEKRMLTDDESASSTCTQEISQKEVETPLTRQIKAVIKARSVPWSGGYREAADNVRRTFQIKLALTLPVNIIASVESSWNAW